MQIRMPPLCCHRRRLPYRRRLHLLIQAVEVAVVTVPVVFLPPPHRNLIPVIVTTEVKLACVGEDDATVTVMIRPRHPVSAHHRLDETVREATAVKVDDVVQNRNDHPPVDLLLPLILGIVEEIEGTGMLLDRPLQQKIAGTVVTVQEAVQVDPLLGIHPAIGMMWIANL